MRLAGCVHGTAEATDTLLVFVELISDVFLYFYFTELCPLARMLQVGPIKLWKLYMLTISLGQHLFLALLLPFGSTRMHAARVTQIRHLHPCLSILS